MKDSKSLQKDLDNTRKEVIDAINQKIGEMCLRYRTQNEVEGSPEGFIPFKRSIVISSNDDGNLNEVINGVHTMRPIVQTEYNFDTNEMDFDELETRILILILERLEYVFENFDKEFEVEPRYER